MPELSFLLPDSQFSENLHNTVLPYLGSLRKPLEVPGCDGKPLSARYYALPQPRAVVCLSHGFCEFADKYSEIIYYFLRAGYDVAICEHRGHGFSPRELDNLSKVHIHSYDTYVEDYHCFVQAVRAVMPPLPLYLFGHSMGGCIAALYLERYPEDFDAAVLSSPMLEINTGKLPKPLGLAFGRVMTALGKGRDYLGSQDQDFRPENEPFETSCCMNHGRWQAWLDMRVAEPHYQTQAGSIEWMTASLAATARAVRDAARVTTPVLLCQAGRDTLVLPGGQQKFIDRCKNGKLVRFPLAKHETFNATAESRRAFWEAIFQFLAEQPVPASPEAEKPGEGEAQ